MFCGCNTAGSDDSSILFGLLSGQFPYSSQVAFGPVPIQQSGCFRASSHTAVRLLSGQFPYSSQVLSGQFPYSSQAAFGPVPIQQSGRFPDSSHTTVSLLAVIIRLLSGVPCHNLGASNEHRILTVSSNGYFVLRRIRHRHSFY